MLRGSKYLSDVLVKFRIQTECGTGVEVDASPNDKLNQVVEKATPRFKHGLFSIKTAGKIGSEK